MKAHIEIEFESFGDLTTALYETIREVKNEAKRQGPKKKTAERAMSEPLPFESNDDNCFGSYEISVSDESPNPSRAGEPKRIIPEGSYFVAQCEKCGFKGESSEWKDGGQIADTGDYGDCYCPICGQADVPEADDDTYIDQRELFMKTIDNLNGRISDLSWKAEAKKMDREGEISPVSAIKERIKEMLAKSKKEWATSDDHGQYKYSSGYEDALLELLKYLDEIPPTTAPEKCVCVDKIGDNAGCTHPNCSRYAQTPAPEVKKEKKHIHVALPGGAMANVSPDASPALLDALNRMVNLAKNAPAEQPALPDPKTECTCICGPTDADPNCAWPNCFKSENKGEITGDNLREWAIEESKHLAQRDKDFFFLGVGQLWERVGPQISALVKELGNAINDLRLEKDTALEMQRFQTAENKALEGNAATLTKERDNLIASVEGWEGKYHQAEAELDEAKKSLTQRSDIIHSLNDQLKAEREEKGEYREALEKETNEWVRGVTYETHEASVILLAKYFQPDQTTKP